MDEVDELRAKNAKLLETLHAKQALNRRGLSHLKTSLSVELNEEMKIDGKENISRPRKRCHEIPLDGAVDAKRSTPSGESRIIAGSSSSARKKLQSKSILKTGSNNEAGSPDGAGSPGSGSRGARKFTSTPVLTKRKSPRGRRNLGGPRTPASVKKRRAIIDRNVTVDSSPSLDKSLRATPVNPSKTLNFSYATPSSLEKRKSPSSQHRYPTRASSSNTLASVGVSSIQQPSLLNDDGNNRKIATLKTDPTNRTCLLSPAKDLAKKTPTRVTFQESLSQTYSELIDDQQQQLNGTAKHRQGERPLLGYDWIAGVLDNAEQSLDDKPDVYFEEMKAFRNRHKKECVKSSIPELKSPVVDDEEPNPEIVPDPEHTCIHTYNVNSRLFTVPINQAKDGASYCPICRSKRKQPTSESPGFVRISIPSNVFEAVEKRRPHRRKSFEPSDSCALSEHCLAGYDSSRPATLPAAKNLDLKHAAKGVRAKMDTNESEVNKIVRESKRLYREPDDLRKTKTATRDLRKRCPDLADGRTSRRLKTDGLLNTSHAIRHQLQTIERKYHDKESAANSTKYPLL
ncbi:uncharacterized protein LOC141908710 [Tubulanus polymorphus]|uniref:uncharacterized protein LOC141908710 n=1 Tax=Tubulanus polymorphus TaxID=672921 RepID=UPI003DA373DE